MLPVNKNMKNKLQKTINKILIFASFAFFLLPGLTFAQWSTGNYYTPSSSSYSTGNYYTPSRSTVNSYLPARNCTGSRCSGSTAGTHRYGSSTGGYTYGSSGGYNYLPTSGGGGGGMPSGGALGLNLNYSNTEITDNSDNSVRIIDRSRTDNSVRNSTTTTTNSCSNVGSASSTGNCNTNTVNNNVFAQNNDEDEDDLKIICRVSDTSIDKGDTVKFTVEIDGGRPSYRIEWDGDISGDDDEERVRFNRSGTYRVSVEVRDANGHRASDDCAVVRVGDDEDEDEDDDDRRITVTTGSNLNTPNGNLAGLESVFLSQVPYTGPADVAKVLGILALIAVWSTAVAMYFKKQRAFNSVSNKIADFKERNKSANKIA